MSGVPERLRGLSDYEFYNTAIALRVEVLALVTGSAIPKSMRFTFAVPMAGAARDVVRNIVRADSFYPNTVEGVSMRRRYLTLAMADCEQVLQDAQSYLALCARRGDRGHVAAFERVCELCERERSLIKGARDRVRLIVRTGR